MIIILITSIHGYTGNVHVFIACVYMHILPLRLNRSSREQATTPSSSSVPLLQVSVKNTHQEKNAFGKIN